MILKVCFDYVLNPIYKYNWFFKALWEKNLKFLLSEKDNLVLLLLYFILLPSKICSIIKNQNYKKGVFIVDGFNYLKIILALLIKIIKFYILVFIVEIRIFEKVL